MSDAADPRPLIAHVLHRFDVGGLENGVVNLVNHLPSSAYRHAIIALTEVTEFRHRILRDDVTFVAMNKRPGHGYALYPRVYELLRKMGPAIVHTRNLAALEMAVPAWAAGAAVRLHGEHGWDVGDLQGSNRRHRLARRLYRPFVSHYVALSRDLHRYLRHDIGVPERRITRIHNGVDTRRFHPALPRNPIEGSPFNDPTLWLVGSVGRMAAVKDPVTLARAFVRMRAIDVSASRARLIMVGEGPLRSAVREVLAAAGQDDAVWLPGERGDVPAVLRGLDCYVLPSLAEGISNTVLEAMASGLPVIATAVGGNAELVEDGRTGHLVPAADPEALAHRMLQMANEPAVARAAGAAGRMRVEHHFSIQAMIARYQGLYDRLLRPPEAQSLSMGESR
jgi:sugar transferase (PEP-CTERM/EpsH1 system associated)